MVKHGVGPAAMADIFINEVRRTAAVNKRVGRGVMVSSIPRAVLETDDLTAISSHPTRSELCFAHLRHDDVVGVAEGPHFVRPGERVFSNFKTWREGDAEYVQVDFRAA